MRRFVSLAKLRLNALVVFAVAASFYVASTDPVDWWKLVRCALGAGCVAMGGAALNMVMERPYDALMERTRDRPLPRGDVSQRAAIAFGSALCALGLVTLALINLLSASIALVIVGSYLLLYTPLKRRTNLNTIVGAVPGALPAVLGWTGARDAIEHGAWILFAIVFFWQIPHFLAIARLHRDDYEKGGFHMLSAEDAAGFSMGRQALVWAIGLLPVGLLPAVAGLAEWRYFWIALPVGLLLIGFSIDFAVERGRASARRLFIATLVHLPVLFIALVVLKT